MLFQIGDPSFVVVSDPLHEVLDVLHWRELLFDLRKQATVRIELLGVPVNHQGEAAQVALDDAHLRVQRVKLLAPCLQPVLYLANLATQFVAKLTHFPTQLVAKLAHFAMQAANLHTQIAYVGPQVSDLSRQAVEACFQVIHPSIRIVHHTTPDGLS